jgi:hypothetical protein
MGKIFLSKQSLIRRRKKRIATNTEGDAMEWFRSYSKKVHDPRLSRLTNAQFGMYHKLECLANSEPSRDGSIIFGSSNVGHFVSKCMTIRTQSADKFIQKLERLNLIRVDGLGGKIFLKYWNEEQKPSDNSTPRVQKHRARKRCGNGQIDREIEKHPSKDVSTISNSFLDNSGSEDANGFSPEVSPIDSSPKTEKPKDTFKGKDETLEKMNLVPPPSTNRIESTPIVQKKDDVQFVMEKIVEYSNEIVEKSGSTGIHEDVREVIEGPHGNSTQCKKQVKRSLLQSSLYGGDSAKGYRAYFRTELKARYNHDQKHPNTQW